MGIKTTDLRALLSLYGIHDDARVSDLIDAAKEAKKEPWWKKDYGDIASDKYIQYVEFEQTAEEILNYEPLFVPGILQTQDYANAITVDLAQDPQAEHLDKFVVFRLERQKLLRTEQHPKMSFVLDESAVRRRVGNADIMLEQLSHLTDLAEHPDLSIRILPFTAGVTYGVQTPFVLMRLPDLVDSPVLYFEAPRGSTTVLDDEEEIKRYSRSFGRLQKRSLSEHATIEFLKNLASE